MPTTVRAYSITSDAVAAERERTEGKTADIDVSKVITLDELELPRRRSDRRADAHPGRLGRAQHRPRRHSPTPSTSPRPAAASMYPGQQRRRARCSRSATRSPTFKAGDIVITHCNGEPDEFGFPLRIWAYDQPDSIGWYAEEAVVGDWQLIHAPLDCGLNLWEIAALPLRGADGVPPVAAGARHLPRQGHRASSRPCSTCSSFGGGVGELFLQLAKAEGHNAYFCSGSPERRAALEKLGIIGIDQKQFNRFATRDDVNAFRKEVRELTDGEDMHIVCDMLRGPVFPAGLAVAAREGVNVSAGWQLSQVVEYNSTLMSVKQVTIDHTHYETIRGLRGGDRALRQGVQADRPQGDLRLRGPARAPSTRCTRTPRPASRSCGWPRTCPTAVKGLL